MQNVFFKSEGIQTNILFNLPMKTYMYVVGIHQMVFSAPFNIILVISRQWKGDKEMLCAMKGHKVMS